MWPNPQFSADLVKFTEEIPKSLMESLVLNWKVFILEMKFRITWDEFTLY